MYGIDWNGPVVAESHHDHDQVAVLETQCLLTSNQLQNISSTVNPMEECNDYGLSLYIATRDLVNTYMNHSQ